MTETANLRSPGRRYFFRMHDEKIRTVGIRLPGQAPQLALLSSVALTRAVACLAADAQFRYLRMPRLRRAIVVGLGCGRVTPSAHVIPGLSRCSSEGADKGRVPCAHRCSGMSQVNGKPIWQLPSQRPSEHLHVVGPVTRPGGYPQAQVRGDPGSGAWLSRNQNSSPFRAGI
jgi:hypothetical protein